MSCSIHSVLIHEHWHVKDGLPFLIIDEILLDSRALYAYIKALHHYVVYHVGVVWDREVIQKPEMQRQDRSIGLSNDQIHRVHQGVLNAHDLTVGATAMPPVNAASHILQFIECTPNPTAFSKVVSCTSWAGG